MEILWWLAPSGAVLVLAMLWVTWLGHEGRGEITREEALARIGRALDRPVRVPSTRPAPPRDRSTGLAVRPSRAPER